jgi:hypothetical protein
MIVKEITFKKPLDFLAKTSIIIIVKRTRTKIQKKREIKNHG